MNFFLSIKPDCLIFSSMYLIQFLSANSVWKLILSRNSPCIITPAGFSIPFFSGLKKECLFHRMISPVSVQKSIQSTKSLCCYSIRVCESLDACSSLFVVLKADYHAKRFIMLILPLTGGGTINSTPALPSESRIASDGLMSISLQSKR